MRKVATRSKEKAQTSSVLQPPAAATVNSGLRDTYSGGKVGDFLREKIQSGSTLSVVSAYFTIYVFEALKTQLDGIASLRFLFESCTQFQVCQFAQKLPLAAGRGLG